MAFQGFDGPKQNWSRLPHQLIEELPKIDSLAEMKVILYILRHTWGYGDESKRITVDEFVNGRKRKDGTRIDNGCGIASNSVRSGLRKAEEHGYILVEVDDTDKARIEKFYSINTGGVQDLNLGVQKLNPDVQKLNLGLPKVEPRTEKETIERNLGKEAPPASTSTGDPYMDAAMNKFNRRQAGLPVYGRQFEIAEWNMELPAKTRTPIAEAIAGATGKRALWDAGDDKLHSQLHRAAIQAHKMGYNVERINSLADDWRADWRGKGGGSVTQFVEFLSERVATVAASKQRRPRLAPLGAA